MLNVLVRNWWTLALRGLLAVAFGIMAFVWPGITLSSLIILFAAFALADGVLALVAAVQQRGTWWMLLIEGLVGIGAGVATMVWPGMTALALLYLIASWAVVTGVLEIIAAIKLRKVIEGELLLALSGVASIAFGVMMMVQPGVGALAVVWLIGAYAMVFGVSLIALGFRLRARRTKTVQSASYLPPLHDGARA
jgi:uncharacterized membrane protein HdeD (DUF308 family)